MEKADQSAESGSPSHLSREDFDQVIDEFLSTQEVYGGKLKERLGAVDLRNVEKLDLFRKELGPPLIRSRDDVRDEESESSEEEDEELLMPRSAADERDKWDVETVLCELRTRKLVALYSRNIEFCLRLEVEADLPCIALATPLCSYAHEFGEPSAPDQRRDEFGGVFPQPSSTDNRLVRNW